MRCFRGGALPMDVLSTRIHEWVGQQKAQASMPSWQPNTAASPNQN